MEGEGPGLNTAPQQRREGQAPVSFQQDIVFFFFHIFCSVFNDSTISTLSCSVARVFSVPLKVTEANLSAFHGN